MSEIRLDHFGARLAELSEQLPKGEAIMIFDNEISDPFDLGNAERIVEVRMH
jgi:hypothetical protein